MASLVSPGIACRSRDAFGRTDPPIVAGPALGTKTRGFRTVRTLLFGWLAGRSRGEAGLRARPGRSESAGRGAPLENSAPPPGPTFSALRPGARPGVYAIDQGAAPAEPRRFLGQNLLLRGEDRLLPATGK